IRPKRIAVQANLDREFADRLAPVSVKAAGIAVTLQLVPLACIATTADVAEPRRSLPRQDDIVAEPLGGELDRHEPSTAASATSAASWAASSARSAAATTEARPAQTVSP